MSQIRQVGGRLFQRILDEKGIDAFNGAQGKILYALWEGGEMPIVELSRRTGLAKTTLSSMLDRMERAGLVERAVSPSDRRKFVIALTDRARDLRPAYDEVSDLTTAAYYKGFSDEEIEQFEGYLRRILANLNGER